MKAHFSNKSLGNYISLKKPKKSILKQKRSTINLTKYNLQRNLSSNRLSFNSNTTQEKKKSIKILNPEELVYNSPFLQNKPRDYVGLCGDLKKLERQNRMFSQLKNDFYDDYDEEFDFLNMNNNLKLNETSYDYNDVVEILKIVEKVKIPPEKRKMVDLLEIVKYLKTTKLGKYFKEGFEQKEIFEKLITFCGVEIKYKFFKKGETVFRIGDLPDNFYIILWGKVDILKPLPKKMMISGHQYFCYLMQLLQSKDEHLFNLCIKTNKIHFRIDVDDTKDLKYIYLYIILAQISRHKFANFGEALKLVDISYKEFNLEEEDKLSDPKYIFENMKKIKIYLPDIPTSVISKYLFFKETQNQKEVILYYYSSFLTLDTKSHFGDSAMDSNTTRNATIAATEDIHTAYISCSSYFHNVVSEKAALIDKKVHFLNTNFIFGKINQKRFEQKYFGLFINKNYKKGDIIYHEGDLPLNVYFIEKGDVELYSSKNIFELQKVIEYLEKKRFKFMKKNDNNDEKYEEKEQEYIHTYDKINLNEYDLRKEIIKKEKNKIVLLKENEDLGLLSFYFGYPYLATSIVSSASAKIYQIDNKYLSEIILKEKICYFDLINRIESKLFLLHDRLFKINNT